jgi:hypothetical protein
MRRLGLAAICALAAFAATPASACFAPYAHQLLDEVPDNRPPAASVLRLDFTNHGAVFREWQGRVPVILGTSRFDRRRFVGVARRIDGEGDGVFPVYARVTSCTPDFDYGDAPEALRRRAYLVGRFVELGGQQVFVVLARGADGSWESFDGERP